MVLLEQEEQDKASRFQISFCLHYPPMHVQPIITLYFIITCTHANQTSSLQNKTSHGLVFDHHWPARTQRFSLVCFLLSSYPISQSNLVWFQSNSLATYSLSSLLSLACMATKLNKFQTLSYNFKSIILTSQSTYNINPWTTLRLKSLIKYNHGLNKHFIRSLEFKIVIHHLSCFSNHT